MTGSNPLLEVRGLRVDFDGEPVVRGVDLAVAEGELLALMGPNGAGKSTLLRAIAGFERVAGGSIRLDGADLRDTPPHRRKVGLLFQDPALFPNRTVFENVAYAPLLQRRPDREVRDEVDRLAALLALEPLLDRRPAELSGGERQRTALARTLAARPRLVLLDEPFASVDVEVKATLRTEFRAALRASGTAAVHVTHDRDEGLFLGDRVALLFEGRLEWTGTPQERYAHPTTTRAARFLGYNVLVGPDGPVAVHPEDLRFAPGPSSGPLYTVVATGSIGRRALVVLEGPERQRVEASPTAAWPVGAVGRLTWERSEPVRDGTALLRPAKEPKKPPRLGNP